MSIEPKRGQNIESHNKYKQCEVKRGGVCELRLKWNNCTLFFVCLFRRPFSIWSCDITWAFLKCVHLSGLIHSREIVVVVAASADSDQRPVLIKSVFFSDYSINSRCSNVDFCLFFFFLKMCICIKIDSKKRHSTNK